MRSLTRRLAGSALWLAALALPTAAAAPAQARDAESVWPPDLVWHQVAGNSIPAGWKCGSTYNLPQLSYQACIKASPDKYFSAILVHNRNKRDAVPINNTHLTTVETNPNGTTTLHETCTNSAVAPDDLVMCWSEFPRVTTWHLQVQAFVQSGTGGTVHSPVVPL